LRLVRGNASVRFFCKIALPDRAKAEGVVGADIHEGNHGWQMHVIEFFAIGTAVLPMDQEIAPEKIPDPIMVLSVND
jgi:hypothetical protein